MLYPIEDSSYRATGQFQEPSLVASSKQLSVIFQRGTALNLNNWKSELNSTKILKLFQLLELLRVLQSRKHQDRTLQTRWQHLFIHRASLWQGFRTHDVPLPHILTKCFLNQKTTTQVTRQQSKMFKDVKEFLEPTSRPKMLIKLSDKDLILNRNRNGFTCSSLTPALTGARSEFKHNPLTFQVLYKPLCLCPVCKQEKVTHYIIYDIFHLFFFFFCEDIKAPTRDLILSTARELEQYSNVKDNLPVKVNKLIQLFFH